MTRRIPFYFLLFLLVSMSACRQANKPDQELQDPGPVEIVSDATTEEEDIVSRIPRQIDAHHEQTAADRLSALWDFETTQFEWTYYEKNEEGRESKAGLKLSLWLAYPVTCPNRSVLSSIHRTITDIFSSSDNDDSYMNSFNAENDIYLCFLEKRRHLADNSSYPPFLYEKEEGSYMSDYEIRLGTSIQTVYPDIFTLSTYYYSYTGGAHWISNFSYDNIDLRTGKQITEEMLFKEGYKEKLAKIIQSIIKARNKSLNSEHHISLLVKLGDVEPNGNFIITDRGITYVYNADEISSYVCGVVKLTVPYVLLDSLIADEYTALIKRMRSNPPFFEVGDVRQM